MKKFISMIFTSILVLSLVGCGSAKSSSNSIANAANKEESNQAGVIESEKSDASDANISGMDLSETTDSNGKTIVVYFSASGNTKRVAELTASELGADLFEIEPAKPYTAEDLNWMDRNSRVCKEHDDASLQDIELVTAQIPDWDEYDTVIIGYPLWWREAAWPINNFIKSNDFTGKTVVPFCTSTSSGFGDSGKNLEKMAGSGNWLDGQRFSEHESDESVIEWVQSLDLE